MLVMSNLFTLRNGTLVMNPARLYPTLPLVKLGDPDFTKVSGGKKGRREGGSGENERKRLE